MPGSSTVTSTQESSLIQTLLLVNNVGPYHIRTPRLHTPTHGEKSSRKNNLNLTTIGELWYVTYPIIPIRRRSSRRADLSLSLGTTSTDITTANPDYLRFGPRIRSRSTELIRLRSARIQPRTKTVSELSIREQLPTSCRNPSSVQSLDHRHQAAVPLSSVQMARRCRRLEPTP